MIHLQGLWEPTYLTAARIATKYRIPYAVTLHGMLEPWPMSKKRLRKVISLILYHKRLLRNAAFVQVLNEEELQFLSEINVVCNAVIVGNGISTGEFHTSSDKATSDSSSPLPHDYFLFLARLHRVKGLDVLLSAYADFVRSGGGNVHLVIAGPDDGEGGYVRAEVSRLSRGPSSPDRSRLRHREKEVAQTLLSLHFAKSARSVQLRYPGSHDPWPTRCHLGRLPFFGGPASRRRTCDASQSASVRQRHAVS